MNTPYAPQEIEPKWQHYWEKQKVFHVGDFSHKPKYFCLNFFPYPSGDGLHVGHCRNYIPTDVIARFMRMRGFNVLHPMGWDAFGEPTEQAAIREGIHPRKTTDQNTANFRRQMKLLGLSYDWSREIDSSKPEFYRWTQRFFLQFYERGLAFRDTNWQWWCPKCKTTLSAHEAAGGVCWRGHKGITKRQMSAWYFKITAYADELVADLDALDWPERIKAMQRNWIGRSEGCEIDFITPDGNKISVFTTRPDTIYGATFFVLAPEHPLVPSLIHPDQKANVEAYIAKTIRMSEIDRTSETHDKTGVFTGGHVIHPLTRDRLPIWIASYALTSYGTGAVMGVPAHDERDFEFANKFDLPVKAVITSDGTDRDSISAALIEDGRLVNSGPFNGLPNRQAIPQIIRYLQEKDLGRPSVNYKMRDWLISRQRFWGTPIPIIYCGDCGEQPVPASQLPVLLPDMLDFKPDDSGKSPLAREPIFVHTTCPMCGGPAERETDTLGGFACSSWYFLRFTSPDYHQGPFEPAAARHWMPVDLYIGGAEHAVLHLLYARFWTKALADMGLIPFREPFTKLLNQGILHAADGKRMSKSAGNAITPDEAVATHGADALRLFELFIAPFDQDVNWSTDGINGAQRFLQRLWNLYDAAYQKSKKCQAVDPDLERKTHQLIKQTSQRIENFRFNTIISGMMEFLNALYQIYQADRWRTATFHQALDGLLILLSPLAPHIAEELWQMCHSESVHKQPWPIWEEGLAAEEFVDIAIQINGKFRAVLRAAVDANKMEIQSAALASPAIQRYLAGQEIKKVIYVPAKVINLLIENTP